MSDLIWVAAGEPALTGRIAARLRMRCQIKADTPSVGVERLSGFRGYCRPHCSSSVFRGNPAAVRIAGPTKKIESNHKIESECGRRGLFQSVVRHRKTDPVLAGPCMAITLGMCGAPQTALSRAVLSGDHRRQCRLNSDELPAQSNYIS